MLPGKHLHHDLWLDTIAGGALAEEVIAGDAITGRAIAGGGIARGQEE